MLAVTSYSFVITYCLVAVVDVIPGLEVLATDDEIVQGIDAAFVVSIHRVFPSILLVIEGEMLTLLFSQGESYYESQWVDEADWHPFDGMLSASPSGRSDGKFESNEMGTAACGPLGKADDEDEKSPQSRVRVQEAV